MDREAWWATVNGVVKSWTQLKSLAQIHTHMLHFSHLEKKKSDECFWVKTLSGN